MAQFVYLRNGVPIGASIKLEVQYFDVVGHSKDTDSTPTVEILDALGATVRTASSSSVVRIGLGHYRLDYEVDDGFEPGAWSDIWRATLDGYALANLFDFTVNSQGRAEAVSTIVEPELALGDDILEYYTQDEIRNINRLLKLLKSRLRNTAYKPDGSVCNVFDDNDLIQFLLSALSEFNMTPTITNYLFSDPNVVSLFSDILTQGAMLIAWSGQSILESGREFTITDNGVVVQPPPVSATINTQFGANLTDYRAKLKEIKRNLRPSILGMGAGSILVASPAVKRLRHRRELQII